MSPEQYFLRGCTFQVITEGIYEYRQVSLQKNTAWDFAVITIVIYKNLQVLLQMSSVSLGGSFSSDYCSDLPVSLQMSLAPHKDEDTSQPQ